MKFSKTFEWFERNMEKIARKYGNSANRHLGTSTRRSPNQNKQEAQAGMNSYNSEPNQTRLPTPKTSTVDPQLAEIAKIIAELAAKPAAIRQDDVKQQALHGAKEAEILAETAAKKPDIRSKMSVLRAQRALMEKQTATLVAAKTAKQAAK